MIKFEEHDNQLFRMLDKPVQLKEKNTNVLVQFITHGVIGEYVMEHWLDCGQENAPIFVDSVDSDGDVIVFIENVNKYGCPFPMFEIIGYPVEEGSRWWALYQMMQGKKVSNKGAIGNVYLALNQDGNVQYYDMDNLAYIGAIRSKLEFGKKDVVKTGWQLYKEPKPEPAKEPEIVAHKQHANCLVCGKEIGRLLDGHATVSIKRYSISSLYESTYSHYCGKCFLELGFDATERELRNRQQPIAEPEPAMQYKVGDWVEFIDVGGRKSQGKYLSNTDGNAIIVLDITSNMRVVVHTTKIIRKLSPSEVIVHIGCLSGTIKDLSYAEDGRFWFIGRKTERCPGGMHCILYLEMLDTPTRKLVESLLEAQEEE
jgi:hypothetical protein